MDPHLKLLLLITIAALAWRQAQTLATQLGIPAPVFKLVQTALVP